MTHGPLKNLKVFAPAGGRTLERANLMFVKTTHRNLDRRVLKKCHVGNVEPFGKRGSTIGDPNIDIRILCTALRQGSGFLELLAQEEERRGEETRTALRAAAPTQRGLRMLLTRRLTEIHGRGVYLKNSVEPSLYRGPGKGLGS
jgi:hypothetical protein